MRVGWRDLAATPSARRRPSRPAAARRARPSAAPARAATTSSPALVPGVFIRASLPRPSTSCAGTIASSARDESASSISSQSARPGEAGRRRRAAECATSRARVACRACSCRRRCCSRWFSSRCGLRRGAAGTPSAGRPSPGSRARRAARSTGGVITPRSSAISGSGAELALGRVGRARRRGRGRQRPRFAVRCALRDRPVRDEAAEVVDAGEVDELERPAEALDPPAVARRAQRASSRRAGCPRAGRSRSSASGGAPATTPVLEELRVRRDRRRRRWAT